MVGKFVELGFDGEVMDEGSRQIRPNQAGEVQVDCEPLEDGLDGEAVDEGNDVDEEVGSSQPNHPGVWHELLDVDRYVVVVTVTVGAGAAEGVFIVLDEVVVVGSLHPNQPGISQVEDELGELLDVVVVEVVVVSSRQPHQPGVLQVSVRVRVNVLVLLLLVVVSVPLLSKNFQL